MKNFKLIMLSIILGSWLNAGSQEYIPFNFEDGIWLVYQYSHGQWCDRQYFANGDTLINGSIYYKLFQYYKCWRDGKGWYEGTRYYCAIRNTENKQVEVFSPKVFGKDEPILLYDFNLTIGDTIYEDFTPPSYGDKGIFVIVDSIDSVNVCNKYRKRYHFREYYQRWPEIQLVEGIGFNCGFIDRIFYPHEEEYKLKCYTERNNKQCKNCQLPLPVGAFPDTIWITDTVNPVDTIRYIDTVPYYDTLLVTLLDSGSLSDNIALGSDLEADIYPIPTENILYINFNKQVRKISYELISNSGVILRNSDTMMNTNNIQLDVSGMAPGIYFLRLKINEDKRTYKVLIHQD